MIGPKENPKAPCDKCNAVAPEEKSAICIRCKKRVHLSCMHNPPQHPECWICETCSSSTSLRNYGRGKSSKILLLSTKYVEENNLQTHEKKRSKKNYPGSNSLKSSGVNPPLSGQKRSIPKQLDSQFLKVRKSISKSIGKNDHQEKKPLYDATKKMNSGTGKVGKKTLQSFRKSNDWEKPLYESSKKMKTGKENDMSIPGIKAAEHKRSGAEEGELLHAFSSLYLHRSHRPAYRAIWEGNFTVHFEEIEGQRTHAEFYGGLVARSTGKVHFETYNFSQKLDSCIHLNTLERASVWNDLFQEDDEELALYFLCKDVKRLTKYQKLLDLLDKNDLLLISSMEDVQLLLFSCSLLDRSSQKVVLQNEKGKEVETSKGVDFLCGVFLVGAKRVGEHS